MAKAHYEDIGEPGRRRYGIIRVGGDDWEFGQCDYDFHTTVVGHRKTAVLKGLVWRQGFTNKHRDAIRRVLLAAGFTHYARWRHRDGEAPRFVRIRL